MPTWEAEVLEEPSKSSVTLVTRWKGALRPHVASEPVDRGQQNRVAVECYTARTRNFRREKATPGATAQEEIAMAEGFGKVVLGAAARRTNDAVRSDIGPRKAIDRF